MGIKFIRNTDDATIVCKISSDKNKSFVFRNRKFDKRNNVVLSNGYTEVTDDDLLLLQKESSTFNTYMKMNKLSIVDGLPQEAMSTEQLVMSLKTENANLKKLIKELQSSSSEKPSEENQKALQDALTAIEKLQIELQEISDKAEEQERMIEALDAQLAAMQEELNEVASDAPEEEKK
jgi:chromosome segregation ATPase